jgi:pSer/pThr/pTyr-binding forkhead associated (FHA) protein
MTRFRSLLICAIMFGALAIPATGAQAASCTDSWKGAVSGVWGVPSNWTTGIPKPTADVCITAPGTYTVTLAPWRAGIADPHNNGASVHSLTLGQASGTGRQTLDIVGQGSSSNSNEQVSSVFLNLSGGGSITAHGRLILDSTDGGSTLPGNPKGGYAAITGASILNHGSVEAEVQDPKNKNANVTRFEAPVTNAAKASVHDSSGLLQATAITNNGTFTVASGASFGVVPLQGVYGSPASFTNDGKFVNDGTVTATQGAGPITWTQAGGSIKGNEVTLQGGATLVDKKGPAQFLMDVEGANLTGTIPAGQKITVVGETYYAGGEKYYGTTLRLGGGTVVNNGTLVLDAQGLTGTSGGPAIVAGGSIRNYGSIKTEVQDRKSTSSNATQIAASVTNEPHANVVDSSGLLQATAVTNDGTFTVASGASFAVVPLQGVFGAPASFTNDGKFINDGTVTATQGVGPITWTQAGGSIKGNEVTLQGGATLVDKKGPAQFLMDLEGANLTGTIPAGQKITVVGEPYYAGGEKYYGTTLRLGGTTVVNDGTLVLDAQGSGNTTGGPAIVADGSIENNGAIDARVQDPSWTVQYQAGLANTHTGTLALAGGTFNDNGGAPVTNDGTVKVGPGALYLLDGASAFTNMKDGRIVPQVASAKSFGRFQMTNPCCIGPGKFTAGGGLRPALVGGYTPAANTEFRLFLLSGGTFTGTFSSLGKGFTADYTHESASHAFVGAIYHKSK